MGTTEDHILQMRKIGHSVINTLKACNQSLESANLGIRSEALSNVTFDVLAAGCLSGDEIKEFDAAYVSELTTMANTLQDFSKYVNWKLSIIKD